MTNNFKQDIKNSQKCENIDDFWELKFNKPAGMFFAEIFIKLKINPNIVTLLSMIVGVAGGILLFFSNIWINILGILLIILSSIFDCSDGQVARLTNKCSPFGRWLDGVCDGLVYASIYFSLTFKIMNQPIPFTNINFGWIIWLIAVPTTLYFHSSQARMADYFRQIHMYFYNDNNKNELSRSKNILGQLKSSKGFEKFRLSSYYAYTKDQENLTKNMQILLNKIDNEKSISKEMKRSFCRQSCPIIKLTNLLTFNLRTYMMFLFVLINVPCLVFFFTLLVLEPIKIYLIVKYEKIAKNCLKIGFKNEI